MIIVTQYPNLQGVTLTAAGVIDWGTVYGSGGVPSTPTFDAAIFTQAKQRLIRRRRRRR